MCCVNTFFFSTWVGSSGNLMSRTDVPAVGGHVVLSQNDFGVLYW